MSEAAEGAVQALIGGLADAVLLVGARGEVVLANPQAERLFGSERGALRGRPVGELLSAPDGARADPWAPDGASGGVELCLHHRDGHSFPVWVIVAPVALGGQAMLVATLRAAMGSETQASERLAALVRSSADAILSLDLRGVITSWNGGAQRMYGYHESEVLGRPVTTLMDAERRTEMEGVLAQVARGETVENLETQRVAKSGETIVVSLSASPVRDARGAVIGAATVARDMTERVLMEEELRRSNRDLEQFAYVASHDLSEPLRVIAGFVDLLARRYRGRLDDDADRFIDFIVSGVERMQRLIDDLLTYSRAGRGQIERGPVDAGEVVRDVLWALGPQLRERGVELEVGPLPTVQAELSMLRQIFQNLISNAIKFGDADRPVVGVRAVRLPAAWCFEVQDNGAGVESRHAERVFEMFQRLHGRDVPGSGMGLAIVKRLTERLGGRASVGSADPKGSIFRVTIPDRGRPE